jgi:hypothetical protein
MAGLSPWLISFSRTAGTGILLLILNMYLYFLLFRAHLHGLFVVRPKPLKESLLEGSAGETVTKQPRSYKTY